MSVPSHTILCVDDETLILSALKRVFQQTDYQVVIASSGKEALEIMQSLTVDLIISDMRMPEMSGVELLSEVTQKWPQVKQILLTAYSEMDAVRKVKKQARLFAMVDKPWEKNDLLGTVAKALQD